MLRGLLSGMLVLFGASSAMALGPGNQPRQQLARVDPSGSLTMTVQVMKCFAEARTGTRQEQVPVSEQYTEEVDGAQVTKNRTVLKTQERPFSYVFTKNVPETVAQQVQLDDVKAFETDGKSIPTASLKERLRRDTLVVVSGNDQMIPNYYAFLFKPGTVVLAIQRMPGPTPGSIAPPGPAPVAPRTAPADVTHLKPAVAPIRAVSQLKEGQAAGLTPLSVLPNTAPPVFAFAARDGNERYRLRQTTENTFPTTGHVKVKEGEAARMVPVQMTQTIRHSEITTVLGAHLQFSLGSGTAIPASRAAELLARETTVLYSADGEPVDPFWLQNVKPSALVIVGPQPQMGYGYGAGYSTPVPSAPAVGPATPSAPAPALAPAPPVGPVPVPVPSPAKVVPAPAPTTP